VPPATFSKRNLKMAKVKRETNQKKYAPGTLLAVDLYENGNFFEAKLKHYRTNQKKDEEWALVQYLDDNETENWIDLNVKDVVELAEDNVLTQEESENLSEDEKGHLGRRLTVLWLNNDRYSGTITKTLKDKKDFVFISYDCGDKCWYNLLAEFQEPSEIEEKSSTNKRSRKKKSKKVRGEDESSSTQKANDPESKKHEAARKELEKKYPIGSVISVDVYHDEHYHEAVVKKYLTNANKRQQAKGEQWVYIQFLDKAKTKQWIDLSCIKAIKMTEENTLRLNALKAGDKRGFLGKKIVVVWQDGNRYCGLATRCAKDNEHFVFLEYDDGDECWCDLEREIEWNFDGEEALVSDDGFDNKNTSDESVDEGKPRARPKRRGNTTESSGKSTKKAKSTDRDLVNFDGTIR